MEADLHEITAFGAAEIDRHAEERALVDGPTVAEETGVVVGVGIQDRALLRSELLRQRRDEPVRMHRKAAGAHRNAADVEHVGEAVLAMVP